MRKNGKAKQQNVVKLGNGLFAHQHGTGWEVRTKHGAFVSGSFADLKTCRSWAEGRTARAEHMLYAQKAG